MRILLVLMCFYSSLAFSQKPDAKWLSIMQYQMDKEGYQSTVDSSEFYMTENNGADIKKSMHFRNFFTLN